MSKRTKGIVDALAPAALDTSSSAPASAPVFFQATAKGVAFATKRRALRKDGITPAGVGGIDTVSWAAIEAVLATGPQPHSALLAAVGAHKSFVGYCVRRGWLAAVQPTA